MKRLWTESYRFGIEPMDKQHEELARTAQKYILALSENSDEDVCQKLYSKLFEQVQNHFRDEETIMRKTSYPQLKEHSDEHTHLVRTFLTHGRFKRTGKQELIDYFCSWLNDHLEEHDSRFAAFYLKTMQSD
ncbi:bacteriohemerythrin [Desulfovibrio sp. JC010]|uniref:bacteriohemerythrin n=1 Tax=Desulfovibrio sp. JC010 TaxID=2593641 RepID=UPI0013D1949F|nr:hemerythrin domain-containing protein [Desulfovibrio sp. JC010]NDV26570.1 hypothetical protein [Desulfovibrio sp. JC010]